MEDSEEDEKKVDQAPKMEEEQVEAWNKNSVRLWLAKNNDE